MTAPARPMDNGRPGPNGRDESPEQLWLELERILHRMRRAIALREAQWREAQARARRRYEQE